MKYCLSCSPTEFREKEKDTELCIIRFNFSGRNEITTNILFLGGNLIYQIWHGYGFLTTECGVLADFPSYGMKHPNLPQITDSKNIETPNESI
jgi:hypothetical protein